MAPPTTKARQKTPIPRSAGSTGARSARDLFAEAVSHHLAGRAPEAESIYRDVIAKEPGFAEAYNNLGVLVRGRDSVAAHELFAKAAAARPSYVEGLVNLGLSFNERGNLDEAIACFRNVLALEPNNGRVTNDLGAALRGRGDLEEALRHARRAVELLPNDPATHNNLGNVLLETSHLDDARASYERALALRPDYPDALNNLGTTYRGLRQIERALPLFLRALDVRPGFLDALHNLALAIPPGTPGAERIEARLREEVARLPESAETMAVLAVFLQENGRFDEARALAADVLRRDDRNADAWTVLGICTAEAGDHREAIRCYDNARRANPRSAVSRWNRAIALLALGEYEEGWREYESRWDLVMMAIDRRRFEAGEWDGSSSLDGKTILVYTEQGLGDAIQFARFGRELKRRWNTRVIVECDASLVTLFKSCAWVDGVVARGTQRPAFDLHVGLLSLMRILCVTLENIPTDPTFPVVDRPIARRIEKTPGVLDVGIVWGGRAPNPALARRSIDLELLAPLAAVPNVRLHALQLGDAAAQLERCSFGESVQDLSPFISDFVDTASAMARLDLVITIDTSVAHLAGTLGVPVWVMLIKNADWRWLLDRDDSPWYPTARLFRQPTAGDWASVAGDVAQALHALSRGDERPALHQARPDAACVAELPSAQRHDGGRPRFALSVPLASLGDEAHFARYATELAGDGVDAEARAFFDAQLGADDVLIDVEAGWGFTALGAATSPTPPQLVVAVVSSAEDAAVISSGARSATQPGPLRIHVRGDGGTSGLDDIVARQAPQATRVVVRAQQPGEMPALLATAAGTLARGALVGCVWNLRGDAGDLIHQSDTIVLETLAAFGFEHFVMAFDDEGPRLDAIGSAPRSRTVFCLRVAQFQSTDDRPARSDCHPERSEGPALTNAVPVVGMDWQIGATSGWGVYGMNLARRALATGAALPAPILPPALDGMTTETREALAPVVAAHGEFAAAIAHRGSEQTHVPFVMLRALGNGLHVAPHGANIIAQRNVGVVFFESTDLDAAAIARARRFDRIIAGSTWNAELLRGRGVNHVVTVLQGVDNSVFAPRPAKRRKRGEFIIFSGGKLEYRKGQDIVAAAFREFQRRHPEARLMLAWHNHWPRTMGEIGTAGLMRGVPDVSSNGRADMTGWLAANGIPANAVIDLGLRGNADMAQLLGAADAALFTNRAEGGTNLVAMECLASGVPTILSANTGHLDLIDDSRCFPLRAQGHAKPTPSFPGVEGWGETSVEEAVEALERVYANPADAATRAANAAEWMRGLNWNSQIDRLLHAIRDLI